MQHHIFFRNLPPRQNILQHHVETCTIRIFILSCITVIISHENDHHFVNLIYWQQHEHVINFFILLFLRSEGCHRDIFCKVENTTCSVTLRSRGNMEEQISHKKVSACDEKTFQCKQCAKCFHHVGNLRKHERLHTGEGTHKCNQCEKVFSREETLKQHERTHSGEKPFKCNHCGTCFTHTGALKMHKKNTHRREAFWMQTMWKMFSWGTKSKEPRDRTQKKKRNINATSVESVIHGHRM